MTGGTCLSWSELRVLVGKAARGACLSWGLAEEAGWAAEWLARRGLPAADWAAEWLEDVVAGRPGPVEVGVAMADAGTTGAVPDGLAGPLYLLPFLHRLVGAGPGLSLLSPQGLVASVGASGAVVIGPGRSARSHGWVIAPATGPVGVPEAAPRPVLSASLLDCLETLALRTTVPPSDRSRSDAGASGGDND